MLTETAAYPPDVREAHTGFVKARGGSLAGHPAARQRGQPRRFPATTAARGLLRMLFAEFSVEEVIMSRKITRCHR